MFNVYCCDFRIPGEDGSKYNGSAYSFLIYNRKNFQRRKHAVRYDKTEYKKAYILGIDIVVFVGRCVQKVKADIKKKYNGISEIQEQNLSSLPGVHVHHILPQHSHPKLICPF